MQVNASSFYVTLRAILLCTLFKSYVLYWSCTGMQLHRYHRSASIISISVVNIKLLISFHAQSSTVKLHAESVLLHLFGRVFLKDKLASRMAALIMARYLISLPCFPHKLWNRDRGPAAWPLDPFGPKSQNMTTGHTAAHFSSFFFSFILHIHKECIHTVYICSV